MGSMRSGLLCLFLVCHHYAVSSQSQQPEFPTSISAAPALLPDPPISAAPALSPDVTPLFPSPGGSELSPSDSAMPIIPSSPSPPNPDAMAAPGPGGIAFSPFGSMPASYAASFYVSGSLSPTLALAMLSFWFMRLWSL